MERWASKRTGATGGVIANTPSEPLRPTDSVIGGEHPELLLPTEIFGSFIRAAYAVDDGVAVEFRRDAARKGEALALPSDFAEVIQTRSAEYIALERDVRRIRERLERGAGRESAALREELRRTEAAACESRVKAMTALRTEFATFDRFLYTAIAPGVFFTFYEPQDAEMLRAQERGCR